MAGNKYRVSLTVLSLTTVSLNLILHGLPTQAQVSPGRMLEPQILAGVTFQPPGEETLERSQGGASRDSGYCPTDSLSATQSMSPLMPNQTQQGLTVSARPTFFVYLPSNSAQQVFFTLKDKNEDYYYQKTLSIPETGGIISVQLPEDAPALEVGKDYQWAFVLACQMPPRPDSPSMTGWVKRVELSSVGITQIDPTPSLEMAQLYGSTGIWFDAVTTLAQLREQEPENYTAPWEEFLTSVGLEAIATKPLISSQN
jgi:hypothetical protein